MPLPELSRQEVRLGRFAALCSAAYAVTGIVCALVAHSPRERRVALLPVLGGKLTTSVLALAVLVASGPDGWARPGFRAVFAVFAADFPLFAVSAWLFHSAAPGVHLSAAPTQSSPELPAPPNPV